MCVVFVLLFYCKTLRTAQICIKLLYFPVDLIQEQDQEIVFSIKSTRGYELARIHGDPDVYIPLLKAGDDNMDVTFAYGDNFAINFNALAVNYK